MNGSAIRVPFPQQPFVRCRQVDPELIRETGAFTRFPALLSNSDDKADLGSRRARDDMAALIGHPAVESGCVSSIGNFNGLLLFNSLPERLESISYLNELAFLHDDATANGDDETIATAHKRLDYALNPEDTKSPDDSALSHKMKRLYSSIVLECCEMDAQPALDMIRSYSKEWLRVLNKEPMPTTSLNDYFRKRIQDGGTRVYWWMMAFCHGNRMTEEEFARIEPVIHAAERVFLATNDYYSWQKEKLGPLDRIWNAVLVFMKSESCSEQEAIAKLKQFIIDEEVIFQDELYRFCAVNYDLPPHMQLLVNTLEPSIGGYHAWCAICPRQNDWKKNPPPPFVLPEPVKKQNGSSSIAHQTENGSLKNGVHRVDDDSIVQRASAVLTAPTTYIRSLSSKNVRSQLVDAFNLWLNQPKEVLDAIKETVDGLHQSSLLLDDIQDRSPLRRGKVAAHHIFGEAQTINSATFMFVEVTKRIHGLGNPTMTSVLLQELESLFLGQALDLNWKVTTQCPSKEDYLAMVDRKTGSMFRLILRLLTAARDQKYSSIMSQFDNLARLLGRWYQVRDDYMNLKGGGYTSQKGFCEDLDEGKLSYPILCCCATDAFARNVILGMFRQRATTSTQTLPRESKLQMLDLVNRSGALGETFNLVTRLQAEVEREIGYLEGLYGEANPILRLLILTLSDVPEPDV
ncbi:hypothetical protein CDD80_345 [Ophiocordyceps camponoti-rufipedis]|uniref:Uncharacterized protein n=1 Tax=Ophiocordyceps camponoti-rufipedis TaxID=2004952 RepID=A0A2C5ZFE8_9HYPO|nr:hypothetical protein CDD80_345 [Ophiocordyceps camponoti-rufipedis]